jgi:transcriptional regulator with XRE-family HTH domain
MRDRTLSQHEQLVLTLSTILRDRRELMEISQSDLARRSGLHRSYIGDLERGSRNISVRNLSRLAHAMGMQPSKLLALAEKRMATNPVAKAKGRPAKSKSAAPAKRKTAVAKKTAAKPKTTSKRKTTKRAAVAK